MKIRFAGSSFVFLVIFLLSMRWDFADYFGKSVQLAEKAIRSLSGLSIIFLFLRTYGKTIYLGKAKDKVNGMPFCFVLLLSMQVWVLFSTIANHGDIKTCILGYMAPLVVTGVLYLYMRDKPDSLINGGMLLGEILVYANLLCILLYPNGMYRSDSGIVGVWYSTHNWLLGNKNGFLPCFLYACLNAQLYSYHGGQKWRELGVYAACFISTILTKSAASLVAVVLLLVLILAVKTKKISFKPYAMLGMNAALFLSIVVLRWQEIFSILITSLGKSLSFGGRTQLWDAVLGLVKNNPLLGLGIMEQGVPQKLVGISFAGHAHDLLLDLLYMGGAVYLLLYLFMVFLIYRNLHRFQNTIEAQAIIATLFVFYTAAIVESYRASNFLYLMYLMAYDVGLFYQWKRY